MEGLYGSLKRLSMQAILDLLVSKCGLCSKSHLVDVGAGLGRCAFCYDLAACMPLHKLVAGERHASSEPT